LGKNFSDAEVTLIIRVSIKNICFFFRARFRTLAKPHIDQVTSWAENGQDTVLTSNKGWLYRIFVRKLHENQRRKIISPLRQRFEDVLQNRTYICKKCGGAFIPSQEKLCFSHVAEEPVKSTAYLENVIDLKK
jgi:hypothetical protein